MDQKMKVNIRSEIGKLNGVLLHSPGKEVENMTPKNAERALYSDILNLAVAKKEYKQLKSLLSKITSTFEIKDLLSDILEKEDIKENLLKRICRYEDKEWLYPELIDIPPRDLAFQLIEGVVENKNTLTKYLNEERYSLRPLHNFFYTRDAGMGILNDVLIGKMANAVRERESMIIESIFNHHESFSTRTVNPMDSSNYSNDISIEGGDVLIARDDILCIGNGSRTTPQGIDFILEKLLEQKEAKRHILVQELPYQPESFIHLDMVFTFLDMDKCMVFEPLILKTNRYQTIQIDIENGKVTKIQEKENLLKALKNLGMDLDPVICGGKKDLWIQEREQWHSGANFFALEPGKVIGYERNVHTLEEMNRNGFEIVSANDIINETVHINNYKKMVITLKGSELPRGGGGARCMTMPVNRDKLNW